MKEAIIFSKNLGLNDIASFTTPKANPQTGETEIIDCNNMTTNLDGSIERTPDFISTFTHTAPIERLVANDSLTAFFDGSSLYKWNGGVSKSLLFTSGVGESLQGLCSTPIDIRLSTNVANYKTSGTSAVVLSVGTNPDPQTSKPYYAMPSFTDAFAYNGTLYCVNKSNPKFLQYSKAYHYDLWAIGDDHVGHTTPILQASSIVSEKPNQTGNILLMHENGVTVYEGSSFADFSQKKFSCVPFNGTLASGLIQKIVGFAHVFICNDGIYSVDESGVLKNNTLGQSFNMGSLNDTYYTAFIQDDKYLAFGNKCCIEYDFVNDVWMKRNNLGIVCSAMSGSNPVVGSGTSFGSIDTQSTTTSDYSSVIQFPFADLGTFGAKSISDLYFTGNVTGDVTITAYGDNNEKYWSKDISELGTVSNRRIKVPRKILGNKVSFKIECLSGSFRMERLVAKYTQVSSRTR